MKTTLNKILSHDPCEDGWEKLLTHLGKTEADDEPLSIRTILDSNGIEHAIWALRAVDDHKREIRLFAADCAESVLHIYENAHPDDDRHRKAIEAARRYANGEISEEELEDASRAARYAWYAAWYAVGATRYAAWAAEEAAAGHVAWAAWYAAWTAAAGYVAWAAWYAAWTARKAAENAARDALGTREARDAEIEKQKKLLLKYI